MQGVVVHIIVKVIFNHVELVELLLTEVVLGHLCEGKGLLVQTLGLDLEVFVKEVVLQPLFLQFASDFHGFVEGVLVESSAELVDQGFEFVHHFRALFGLLLHFLLLQEHLPVLVGVLLSEQDGVIDVLSALRFQVSDLEHALVEWLGS